MKDISKKINIRKKEKTSNLNSYKASKIYANNVNEASKNLKKIILDLKKKKLKIAGYGAADKGMTILKCSGITDKHLDYFVDDSPAKQGKFSPVDHIPIISRKEAEKKLPNNFFVLATNYSEIIMKKEKNFIKNGDKFIIPKNGIKII